MFKDFSNSNSSASNWTVSTNRSALESKLNAASKGVGKLKSIQLTPLGNPGKATADRGRCLGVLNRRPSLVLLVRLR